MSQENFNLTAEDRKHFEQLGTALQSSQRGATTAKLSPAQLCADYQKVKGILKVALPIIKKIPVIGGPVGTAIELLMTIADLLCPQTTTP